MQRNRFCTIVMSKEIFIGTENQTLLWTIIQTCPAFRFKPDPERWFAAVIEKVYEQETESSYALLELNKQALLYMLTDLAVLYKEYETTWKQQQKHQSLEDQEQDRIQQMKTRVEKDSSLRHPDVKDEPIKNMEELLLEQQKLRDLDILKLPAPQGEKVDI